MKHLKKIAAHGRNGDTELAHLTPGEVVIPKSVQTPEVRALLAALLGEAGHDLGRYTVGGGDDSRNPKTKLREFYDGGESGSDMSGGGNAGNMGGYGGYGGAEPGAGGGQIADLAPQDQQALGFNPNDLSDTNAATISAFNPMYDEMAQAAQFQPRSMPQRAFDWARSQPREFVQDLKDKPFATLGNVGFNMVTGGIPAAANTVSGWFNGPTFGSGLAAAGRGIGSAMGFSGAPETQVAEASGKSTGAISPTGDSGERDNASGDNYNPTQASASGSGMSPLAQALAGFGVTNDGWNNWGRRKTFGSLVSSYDPNGREYVSPWDYRV